MKQFRLTLLALSIAVGTIACSKSLSPKQVPQDVVGSLIKNYPGAVNTIWKNKGSNYQATFTKNGQKMTILLSPSGQILK